MPLSAWINESGQILLNQAGLVAIDNQCCCQGCCNPSVYLPNGVTADFGLKDSLGSEIVTPMPTIVSGPQGSYAVENVGIYPTYQIPAPFSGFGYDSVLISNTLACGSPFGFDSGAVWSVSLEFIVDGSFVYFPVGVPISSNCNPFQVVMQFTFTPSPGDLILQDLTTFFGNTFTLRYVAR